MPLLFAYGTLQQGEVQLANFGRELDGKPDALGGYRLDRLTISDPRVISISGKSVHLIARQSGNRDDRIEGQLLDLTEQELEAADGYEVEPYRRMEVELESGRTAWAYVGSPLVSPT